MRAHHPQAMHDPVTGGARAVRRMHHPQVMHDPVTGGARAVRRMIHPQVMHDPVTGGARAARRMIHPPVIRRLLGKKNATRFGVAVHKPKALRKRSRSLCSSH